MKRRGLAHSAQYGQACMSCSKAKSRCMIRPDGNGCERCNRIKKQCQPPANVLRAAANTTGNNNQASDERIALVEDRLASLVSQLESRKLLGGDTTTQPGDGTPAEQSEYLLTIPGSLSISSSLERDTNANADNATDPLPESSTSSSDPVAVPIPASLQPRTTTASTVTGSESTDLFSAACLDTFRSRMLHHFPIIHLPADVSAEQLRCDRPLLFQAITCVAWPFARERQARAIKMKRTLCEAAFLRSPHEDRSGVLDSAVDLLLALMIYIAWGWDHVDGGGSLSRLMMLCMSLVGGMHLDRPPPPELHTGNVFSPDSRKRDGERELSLERQRAALGCFVLSSVVSAFSADMDALDWTPQMEELLRGLNANRSSLSDMRLVLQVRLQLLTTRAVDLHNLLQQQSNHEQPGVTAATVFTNAEALLKQVQELRKSPFLSSQQYQQVPLAHTYYAELLVLETIRTSSSMASRPDPFNNAEAGAGDTSTSGAEQASSGYADLSYMWQGVLAISACTSGLLSLPPSDFLGISLIQWQQLTRCVVILSYLENLQDERINRGAARAIVDLPVLLDRIAEKLSLAAEEAHKQEPTSIFRQLASGVRAFRSSIQGSMVVLERPGPTDVSGCGGSNAPPPQQETINNPRFWMDQFFSG